MDMLIVAVDGPAGAGKGTLSRALAHHFSFKHIDTGLIYRALAHKALIEKIDFSNRDALIQIAESLVANDLLNPCLRQEAIGNAASKIAIIPMIREQLNQHIRRFCFEVKAPYKGIVLDGRDIGTVVFTDAHIKIFVTASPDIRAQRRSAETTISGQPTTTDMLAQIHERDQRDQSRTIAPLMPAKDAIVIDTSKLSIDEARQHVLVIISSYQQDHRQNRLEAI